MKNYGKPDIEFTSTGQLLQTTPRGKKIQPAETEEELKVHVLGRVIRGNRRDVYCSFKSPELKWSNLEQENCTCRSKGLN